MTQFNQSQPPAGSGRRGDMQLIIVAIALGVLAMVLTNLLIIHIKNVEGDTITIWRLKRSFAPGDAMKEGDVERLAFPRRYEESAKYWVKGDDIQSIYRREKFERPAGMNEIVSYAMFGRGEVGHTVDIPADKRWKTLAVNTRTAPGNLEPGMKVDIYATFPVGGSIRTLLVLENIKVAVVGDRTGPQTSRRQSSTYRKVGLELTTRQGVELTTVERYLEKPEFELFVRSSDEPRDLQIVEDGINPEVRKIVMGRSR